MKVHHGNMGDAHGDSGQNGNQDGNDYAAILQVDWQPSSRCLEIKDLWNAGVDHSSGGIKSLRFIDLNVVNCCSAIWSMVNGQEGGTQKVSADQ